MYRGRLQVDSGYIKYKNKLNPKGEGHSLRDLYYRPNV